MTEPGSIQGDAPARSAEGALTQATPLATVGLIGGVVGATAVIFGVVLYLLDPRTGGLAIANLVFGVFGVGLYLVTNRKSFGRAVAGRSTAFVVLEVLMALGVLGLVVFANYFAARHPKEWDLTKDGLYSLNEQSVLVARGLKQKITIYGFFRSSEQGRQTLSQAVSLYRNHTDQLELVFVNPDSPPPELVSKFDITSTGPKVVVAAENGRYAKLKQPSEEAMTNALVKVAERPPRIVRFVIGHAEPPLDEKSEESYVATISSMKNEGFVVEAISLIDRTEVPPDTSVLLIAGARQAFFANEAAAIQAFLDRGGRVVALLEPGIELALGEVWKSYGLQIGDDLVFESNPAAKAQDFGMDALVVQSFEPHPITNKLRNTAALFYRARSVLPKVGQMNLEAVTIVQSSATSWGESRYRDPGEPTRDDDDVPGPVPIAVAVTKKTLTHPQKVSDEARLVVFGDHHFANTRFSVIGSDGDLFLNALNWAAGDEDRITIRPKPDVGDRLAVTEAQQEAIMFFSVNLLPLLITGFGFSVWAVRRRT